jgi:Ni,Fe-hydrogenase maturation factor
MILFYSAKINILITEIKCMKIYVFGNPDLKDDNLAIKTARKLKGKIKGVNFLIVKPNQDLPFAGEKKTIIMDVVEKITEPIIIGDNDLGKIKISSLTTVHDFDLGFQLKYLRKIGKLGEVIILGLPQKGKIDYLRIQSILRKLVAQDIQGS